MFLSRTEYHKAKHKNNIEKSTTSYNNIIINSKEYKQELKRFQSKEKSDLILKLRTAKTKDSRQFWQILEGIQKKPEIPILITEFMNNFKILAQVKDVKEFPAGIDRDIGV